MKMKRFLLVLLMAMLLLTTTACSNSNAVMGKAKSAWSAAMGSAKPNDTTEMSHIRFTSTNELGRALGIDTSRTSFNSSGLFAKSGHLFGIMHNGKPRYIVAMDDGGSITWLFNIQSWYTERGSDRLSSLEFTIMATAVSNGVKAAYTRSASAGDNEWHRLTSDQVSKLAK